MTITDSAFYKFLLLYYVMCNNYGNLRLNIKSETVN